MNKNTEELSQIHKQIGDLIDLLNGSSPNNPVAISSARAVCGWCSIGLAMLADRYGKIQK